MKLVLTIVILICLGDWDGGDIKYSFKYDIKEGTSGTDMIPAIA